MKRCRSFVAIVFFSLILSPLAALPQNPKYPDYPSETPDNFKPTNHGFEYQRRDVMIPMRDGVRLHTVILVPNGARSAPILMTRTPYNATALTTHEQSIHLGPTLHYNNDLFGVYDNAADVILDGGYIRVVQDIRGKYGSEGDLVMNRPLHGPQNPTPVDESTDTYDSIDWLIKNIPETNKKVGILGISYDGFLPLMAVVNPHPALKVSIPMNPMVDGWMGDDWFHNGAFRQVGISYIYEQEATRDNSALWWTTNYDDYDTFMRAGSIGELGRQRGMDQIGFWKKIMEHPAYDKFWQDQAMDKVIAAQPLKVPMMLVDSLWDQEDIYGAPAVWKAVKPKDTNNNMLYMVIGPWHHGQEIREGDHLGPIKFGSDTSAYFRRQILAPFLAHFLKDGAPPMDVATVNAFETGTNAWRQLNSWPSGCASGCSLKPTPLNLGSGGTASLGSPARTGSEYDEYISDPAKPVPYRSRPNLPQGYTDQLSWWRWLVDDQREASGRTDVLTYTTDALTSPVKISGQPIVNLMASTSGTDSDWVIKVIDVYPDEYMGQPELGGYQLGISMDIFRGRYRESYETPKAIESNKPLLYKWALPNANHVFLPGHRIMIQIQSSWFPLYDRNPQTFVPNIFFAKAGDYKKATQRVYHMSYIELPVVNM
jgi:putative CocE/NonD family hydrolase